MSSSSDEELIVRNPYSAGGIGGRRSNRRPHLSRDQETKNKALEEMKKARDSGGVHRVNVANLVKPVYEEVDEEEYMKIVRQRQNDDFVVDDDGSGYIDHGVDFLDDGDEDKAKKSQKPKENKEKQKRKAISDFFRATNTKKARKDENTVTVADDPDVEALLSECDFTNVLGENESEETGSSKFVTPIRNPYLRNPETAVLFAPRPMKSSKAPFRKDKSKPIVIAPKSFCSANKRKYSPDVNLACSQNDELMEKADISPSGPFKPPTPEKSPVSPPSAVKNEKQSVPNEVFEPKIASEWNHSEAKEQADESMTESDAMISSFMRTNSEGKTVLRLYWLDAFEDPIKIPGTVYLFGRLYNEGLSESCCVIVKNIWRRIYFLPREKRLVNGVESDEKVDLFQVNGEVQTLLRSRNVKVVKCKPCEKKFAYNDGIIPQSAQVLEVHYTFDGPKLPTDLCGETFSHVFNVTATAMERLLTEVNMKGPSWIEVSDCVTSSPQVSYAKHEFLVDMERMKSISVVDYTDPPPKLKLLTLNIISSMNDKKENEIVLISCIVDQKCSTEKPTADRSRLERFCIVTKPTHTAYPFDLKSNLKQANLDMIVYETMNERHMLNQFLCKLQNLDPDAYVGHDLAAQLSLLSSRLEKLKIAHWSRVGRLKRSITIKQIAHTKSLQWELTAGRLILDSRSSAMELVRMRSYDLYELSSNLMGINRDVSVNGNIATCFADSRQLISFINNAWMDAWLSLAVIVELNALPLFIQITQIVGGVLSRTLMGGRAERNEYLLLHAFSQAGYVVPNKYQPDFTKKKIDGVENVAENDNKLSRNRKAQYMGGLVLEPKIGLYDTLILLLDFNSLYPSIIQEYNICFTTVDQSRKNDDEVPELPTDTNEGILPREIRALVERRREVKKLMKSERLTEQQRQQFDIRQMGLKLTANSIYGCLGFQQSRFYAKPLAALITSRGREILLHTKDLIEKNGFSVIYGDTDSVMINTGLTDLHQVKKLGNDIKNMVNKCHKKLEIDVDGIYTKLLLLKKKKYAALAVDMNDGKNTKRELKGLDIVRRDWSLIAKQVGNEIVDIILSPQSRDEIVEQIHDRLQKLSQDLVEGLLEVSIFEISKQLTRNPEEYTDISAQPHAAVAMRLNATGKFKFHQGDTVSYVICEDGTGKSSTQRAYHCSELQSSGDLKIDLQYYLAHQIHPVVSRLCSPIEECDAVWIAQALGLDSSAYRKRMAVHDEPVDEDSQLSILQCNFDHCESFTFVCPNDGCVYEIVVRDCVSTDEDNDFKVCLSECHSCRRSLLPFGGYLRNQLQLALDKAISDYHKSSYICNDIGCAYRTQTQVFSWAREGMLCPRCSNGHMKKEYTSKMLYEQQIFYRTMFDLTKATENFTDEQKMKLKSIGNFRETTVLLNRLLSLCDQYIADNQYNRVSLSYLFAAMRPL